MKIEITKEILASSLQADPFQCAVAKAVSAKRGYTDVSVTYAKVYARRKDKWIVAEMPPEGKKFIHRFDKAKHPSRVKPVTFELKFRARY